MATSAIGPGFLTQTVVFTATLGASFGFAILVSVLFDLGPSSPSGAWWSPRASGPDPGRPGAARLGQAAHRAGGHRRTRAFNIGNVAGAGLGLDALLGLDPRLGAALCAVIAIGIFLVKEAGRAMDRFAQLMGGVMVVLAVYVAVAAAPAAGRSADPHRRAHPARRAVHRHHRGRHRGRLHHLRRSAPAARCGNRGQGSIGSATRSAILGIGVASLMRVVLFLAALGVVSQGLRLDPANPPASVFQHAAGSAGLPAVRRGHVGGGDHLGGGLGLHLGLVRADLLPPARRADPRSTSAMIVAFIVISTAIFLAIGRPVTILIAVGALNAFVLPIGLGAMLLASRRADLMQGYRPSAAARGRGRHGGAADGGARGVYGRYHCNGVARSEEEQPLRTSHFLVYRSTRLSGAQSGMPWP